MRIFGAKGGGGGGHTPIEAPETGRSKQIVNIVELICEGEIEGLVDGFKSIYLDGTQIQNNDGSYNFNNVSGQLNVGTQDQYVLDGYDSSQNEVNVGVEVKKKNGAIVRTVTDERINRLRLTLGVRSLFHQNNQGDTNGTNVTLKIMIGSRQYTHTFDGKYSSQYLESVIFDNLPPVPFNISVERLTNDSDSQRLQNGTIWSSYTEIIDTEFTYPNSAVAGISFDSEYFNNIPTRNYLIKAKRVKVPSNYDPTTRTYSGFWDGTFKIAWTDNPAWEIYDLGPTLSKMLGVEISFDKWALYDVARYCDQLVPDGMGGQEPRFTCNVWMTEVKTAYDLLNDFCSVFRAIPIWTGTEVSVIIDRPRDPVWTYTNANVVSGFERSYSTRKSRHNAVQVTYSDKHNGYESAIEYISDDEEIRKHGLNLSQVTAFGCTSRGQAHRTGKWILETEKREKETITFTVGREGLMHLPGDIIRVADSHYAGTEIGGRVLAINGRKVTLDREISIDNASYFTYINGEATHSTIKIQSVNGKEITLDSTPTGLETYGVWSLSTKQVTSGLYRSISIVENADGTNTITALQHEPQKEAIVDNAAHFVETARTLYKAPQINAVEVSTGYDGKLYISSDISSGDGKLTYDIKITKDGNLYQIKKGLADPNIELSDLPNGDYSVIIYGKNAKGQIVTERTQTFTIDRPPAPTGVVATGGLGVITLEWDWVNEATQTEIFSAAEDNFALAEKIAKVTARTYAHTLKGDKVVRYYWLRHVRGVNTGPFYQEQGVRGQTAVDLDKRLEELNTELSRNIVNEVFDTAAPARGLELVKTVENLTDKLTKLESSQVYNQADGKLYTWNGTAYSATVPTSDLTGIVPRSKIDTTLISQLTTAANTANAAKSQAESAQSAIQAESANLTKKIQAEAASRGTAITQLQNVDAQQAQLISAVTAKADNALSGLEAERTARASGDRAEAQARELLTTRVGAAEGLITTLQKTVATTTQSISEVSQNLNSKIDSIKVGGRNLLRDSEFSSYNKWGSPQIEFAENANRRTIKVTSTGTSGSVGIYSSNRHSTSYLQQGETYTLSLFARGNKELNYLYLMRQDGGNAILPVIDITSETEFNYYKLTFKAPFTTQQGYLLVGFRQTSAEQFVEFHSVKLEKGNVATDWTSAPEDLESSVSAVSADLTTYKQTQASADLAQSQQITGLTTRMAGAESNITAIQSTKASKTEVASLAQSTLQAIWKADAKSAVDALSIGARNLLIDSTYIKHINYNTNMAVITSSSYQGRRLLRLGMLGGTGVAGIVQAQATQVSNIRQGQEYTLSLNVQGTAGIQKTGLNYVFLMRADGANQRLATIPVIASLSNRPKITFTAEWTSEQAYLLIGVNGTYENTDWLAFHSVKLEKGNVATDWTPAPEDVESSVSAVSAKVDSVQQTLANADSALSSRIDTVVASVGSNSAKITQVSDAVASVDGKLSATHTIKTETIAGGRKAIAGIALGATADNRNAESSVIVMADKFEVVKNSQDGTPVRLFGVVQNKVAINGDLIATGTIKGSHIDADSVRAGVLTAGAIRTEHIAAGQISTDKLAIGLGGNLLQNPIFANNAHGWSRYEATATGLNANNGLAINNATGQYQGNEYLPTENQYRWQPSFATYPNSETRFGGIYQDIKLVANTWYILSGYVAAHRGLVGVNIESRDGLAISNVTRSYTGNGMAGGYTQGLRDTNRIWIKFKATANGTARCIFNQYVLANQSSAPFTVLRRPMLEECTEHTTTPSAWQNAGVTAIHGGSIVSNTVTAQQIAANTITANEIAAGTIAARNMAANSINASHIVGSSITADKLKVTQLSAIAQNVGTLTGGTIKGTNITGNTISGGTITGSSITGTAISGGTVKGTTIEGGTIRGARIEGLTIEAQNIIGDVVKVYAAESDVNITIPASSKSRIAYVMPVILPVRGYFRRIGSDSEEWVYDGASVLMTVNGVAKLSAASGGSNNIGVFQGSFSIPANTQTSVKFSAGGLLSKNTQFIIFCNNA